MKRIKVNPNSYALVDDEDYNYLNQWKWQLIWNGYAIRDRAIKRIKNKRYRKSLVMHREIMKLHGSGEITKQIDHINLNKLDNQKKNLRWVTRSQNKMNMKVRLDNKSGHKGVSWSVPSNKWWSRITVNGRTYNLGFWTNKIAAILAYRLGAKKYHKQYANY
jgi:hypothetical protein